MRNATVDVDKFMLLVGSLAVEAYLWLYEVRLWDEHRQIHVCFNLTAKVERARVADR